MRSLRQEIYSRRRHSQSGTVLMLMLIILIVGAATVLVGSLRSSAVQIDRDKATANALAQAKEALIGYAASDSNHPGNLPCPDVNDDGQLVMNVDYVGSACVNLIGRLPWKTLGLPELRDGAGEHLWYAVSKPFAAIGNPTISSDTQGTLNVSGTATASGIIAIVFAPGLALSGQSRSATANINSFLEGNNAASSTWASPNLSYQSADASPTYNDKLMLITHEQLFHPVQNRIAREVKTCLDSYATAFYGTWALNDYPWAAPVSDTSYSSTYNTYFGRIPTKKSDVEKVIDDLFLLQGVLANYANATNYNVASARQKVIDVATMLLADTNLVNGEIQGGLASDVYNQLAGQTGVAPSAQTPPTLGSTYQIVYNWAYNGGNSIQSQIDKALSQHIEKYYSIPQPLDYGGSCAILGRTYWNDWKDLVFYQVANGNQPGGTGCTTTTCLSINGAGSYRAAVVVAGQIIASDNSPRAATDVTTYLEGQNRKTNPSSPTTTFQSYRLPENGYSTNNDLVQCVDGNNNCK